MHDPMKHNAFNMYCNPASPFYEGNSTRSMFSDDFDIKNDKTPHRQTKPLTKKERNVIKSTAIMVLVLTAFISLLLGLERGFFLGLSAFVYLLIFALMPYIFLRAIVDSIKEKRKNKKHKQLELPL